MKEGVSEALRSTSPLPESGAEIGVIPALQQGIHDVLVVQTRQIVGVEGDVGSEDAARSQRLLNDDVQESGATLDESTNR